MWSTPCNGSHNGQKCTPCPAHSSIIFCSTIYKNFQNKTWATHPEIYIHYRGMHAFHLQLGVAGAILIFIPFPCFVCGVKSLFSLFVFELSVLENHIRTVPVNHKWLSSLAVKWAVRRSTAASTTLKVNFSKGRLIVLWLLLTGLQRAGPSDWIVSRESTVYCMCKWPKVGLDR